MNFAVVFCVSFFVTMVLARPDGDRYPDRWDSINLEEILGNRRLLEPYLKCFLDRGKCTSAAKEAKVRIAEALRNNCSKCTDKQKIGARRFLQHMINNEPGYWTKLVEKYDPEKKYIAKYEKDLKKN